MTQQRLRKPAGPLLAFGEALGIPPDVWVTREGLEQLTYTDPEFSQGVVAALTLDRVVPLLEAYGDAVTCRFLLGDRVELEIRPGLDNAALERFRERTHHSPTVRFDFSLDKVLLLGKWLGSVPGCRLFLYMFPEALEKFLTSGLNRLESRLWGSETARKAILLVPDREIWLDGPYLAVIGGERIGDWHQAVSQELPDGERVQAMYRTCRDTLKWQESWLQYLTPLHLKVEGYALPDDPVANTLWVHLTNAVILYTADRTVARADGQWVATYAGARQSVDLTLGDPSDHLRAEAVAGVSALTQLLEWTYDPQWAADRLPLVQIAVAQTLHMFDPDVRYQRLLRNASDLFQELQWHWKAFIEGRVEAYVAQAQALEEYVAGVVQSFADQVSAMIKSLSDTMLAAVGALLGSLIAALFKDEFNPAIFQIGMVVYAAYVLLFPLGYNMLNQWGRYQALVREFETRRRRFRERLYPQKVNEIVGTQVADSQKRFQRWFRATLVAYVIIILAFVAAAQAAVAYGGMAAPALAPVP